MKQRLGTGFSLGGGQIETDPMRPRTRNNRSNPLRELRVLRGGCARQAGHTVLNLVNPGQTGAVSQAAHQIVCKHFTLNRLRNKQPSSHSQSVKVDQAGNEGLISLQKIKSSRAEART
jgi:hypothetical protein